MPPTLKRIDPEFIPRRAVELIEAVKDHGGTGDEKREWVVTQLAQSIAREAGVTGPVGAIVDWLIGEAGPIAFAALDAMVQREFDKLKAGWKRHAETKRMQKEAAERAKADKVELERPIREAEAKTKADEEAAKASEKANAKEAAAAARETKAADKTAKRSGGKRRA